MTELGCTDHYYKISVVMEVVVVANYTKYKTASYTCYYKMAQVVASYTCYKMDWVVSYTGYYYKMVQVVEYTDYYYKYQDTGYYYKYQDTGYYYKTYQVVDYTGY